MRKVINIKGKRFGRLIAIRPNGKRGTRIAWLCKCDCGNTTTVDGGSLRNEDTKSCGCLSREKSKSRAVHGLSKHPIYYAYYDMLKRCYNPDADGYKYYGGRGIQVKYRNFIHFRDEMISTWKAGLTIDRIDVNGDYKPGNCRWVTMEVQQQNKRNNKLTPASVIGIRQLRKDEPRLTQRKIAEIFGVSEKRVSVVLRNLAWKNVEEK